MILFRFLHAFYRVPALLGPGGSSLSGLQMSTFALYPHIADREWGMGLGPLIPLLIRALITNPIMRALLSWPRLNLIISQRIPHPNTIIWSGVGVELQHLNGRVGERHSWIHSSVHPPTLPFMVWPCDMLWIINEMEVTVNANSKVRP